MRNGRVEHGLERGRVELAGVLGASGDADDRPRLAALGLEASDQIGGIRRVEVEIDDREPKVPLGQ